MTTPPRSSGIMRRWQNNMVSSTHTLCRILIVCAVLSWSAIASATSFEQVDDKLSAWHMGEAKQALDAFSKEAGEGAPATLYLRARYAFLKGDYKGAVPLMEQAVEREGTDAIKAIWRVRTTKNRLRIIDVMVEGISMLVTHRQEFASVIRRHGLTGLLETLRARIGKLPATASNG